MYLILSKFNPSAKILGGVKLGSLENLRSQTLYSWVECNPYYQQKYFPFTPFFRFSHTYAHKKILKCLNNSFNAAAFSILIEKTV